MAAQGSVFGSFMDVDPYKVVQQGGESYLGVVPAYLNNLGWEHKPSELHTKGYYRNWFRNIQTNSFNYFCHLHLVCIAHQTSNLLLMERVKIKAGTELGWWSERGGDGRFLFHLSNATGHGDFHVGVAKALAMYIPPEWRGSEFLPPQDQARMVDVDSDRNYMDMEFPGAFN